MAAGLPRTTRSELGTTRTPGTEEVVLEARGSRTWGSDAGLQSAHGIDENGPWSMVAAIGVPVRLRPDEAVEVAFDDWFARRGYVDSWDPKSDTAACKLEGGSPRVMLGYASKPLLGAPQIELDLETAAVLGYDVGTASGLRKQALFYEWSAADARGVRWPTVSKHADALGNRTIRQVRQVESGSCHGYDPSAPATRQCLSLPVPRTTFEWPEAGIVHLPMRHYLGEISLQVSLHGKTRWALLDSGAGMTVLDIDTPSGNGFSPSANVRLSGAAPSLKAGIGELAELGLASLVLRQLPALAMPLPVLDGFGNRRPELLVGTTLFVAAAVRLDYAAGELTLARTVADLPGPGAIGIPLRFLDGKLVADVALEGTIVPIQIDTGNAGGLSLDPRWSNAHGIPGARKTFSFHARMGAETAATDHGVARLEAVHFGPIAHDHRLAALDESAPSGTLSGTLGNDVLSHCARVTFDLEHRTLWLDPPCTREVPESLAGWRLGKHVQAGHESRPWAVDNVFAGGTAEKRPASRSETGCSRSTAWQRASTSR